MDNKFILIAIIIAVIIIIFIVLIAIVKNNNRVIIKTKIIDKQTNNHNKNSTIKEMVEVAARRDSKEVDLKDAIDIVAKELPFPKKIKHRLPKEAKIYLNFVLLIASHRHCDAKMIAYMDKCIKENNEEYTREIDIYENEGLRDRSRRI